MPESLSTTASSVALDIRQLPWVRPLAADYSYNFPALASFYAGNPREPQAWRERLPVVQAFERDRSALVEVLLGQQEARGAPQRARDAAARLLDPRTVAVVTGQQAGAAGGPLFTLLKSLTAIRLAREVEREHGAPAVAVFWIDAEDHDWQEVASVTVLDADFQSRTLTLPTPARASQVPVASIRPGVAMTSLVDDLRAVLPRTDFTDELLEGLGRAYSPTVGMAEAFGRWLEQVVGDAGLILYDCSDPRAKPLASKIFAREPAHAGRTWQRAAEAGTALTARGYHAQVDGSGEGVALFHLDGGRQPIRRAGHEFVAGDVRGEPGMWVGLAETHPEQFSPNVLLRPLVQDALFPTIAYVAGPSELAYLGQLKGVYEEFGVPMPLIVPRATATVLDSSAARFMAKYHVPLADLQPQDEAGLNRLLQSQLPPQVEASLNGAQQAIADAMQGAIGAVTSLDATLEGAARSALGRMEHELRSLHQKVIHAAKKRDETLRRQFVRTRALAFPEGHPQERALGFVWFLNRYGPALVDILERDLPRDGSLHALLAP